MKIGQGSDADVARATGVSYWTVRRVRLKAGIARYRGKHGSRTVYQRGCRCDACCDAERVYQARFHQRRYACGACGQLGHNVRSCAAASDDE